MNKKIINMVNIAVSTALLAICSWIAVPSVIPITLQTFAVFAVLCLLGGKSGSIAVLVYIIIGALGVPVFSHFKGGLPILLNDPVGGYILGFFVAALIFWLFEAVFGKSLAVKIVSMVLGLLACYLFGVLWYIKVNYGGEGFDFYPVVSACVIPFVIPDAVKLALAVIVAGRLKRHLKLK